MILGIGVDQVEVTRIERLLERRPEKGPLRLFTRRERATCDSRQRRAECYAARFAAKEAFFKALGTGWRDGMGWHEIIVQNDRLGKPQIHLSGKTLEIFQGRGLESIHLSISHEKVHAVAMVVLE